MTLKSLKNNTKNTKNFASSSPSPCPRPQHFDTGGRIRPSFQLALAKGVAQVTCALPRSPRTTTKIITLQLQISLQSDIG